MKIKKAMEAFIKYQEANLKPNTIKAYAPLLDALSLSYGKRNIKKVSKDDIFQFLIHLTEGQSASTKHLRYTQLKAFFNFAIHHFQLSIANPCDGESLQKAFRPPKMVQSGIIDKDTIDEVIYRTEKMRNRLIIELQARCGLRISEVLSLRPCDVQGQKATLHNPKSGKESESAFLPESVAKRLQQYIQEYDIASTDRIFPLSYSGARAMIRREGAKAGIDLRPHDLRRHAATYASRNGVPLEVVSKVILRHQNLRTTQIYLGKISDAEAIRWLNMLYGK